MFGVGLEPWLIAEKRNEKRREESPKEPWVDKVSLSLSLANIVEIALSRGTTVMLNVL